LTVTILEDRLAPAVLTVNSLADAPISGSSSTLTLREAIALVNTGGTATDASGASLSAVKASQIDTTQPFGTMDTITFDAHLLGPTQQVITLTVSELEVSRSVSVVGPGASELALSGNNANRVLDVDGQASVSITGLTVEAGALALPANTTTSSLADDGGGIVNAGALTLTESVVSGNSATNGGGIRNTGTLTLTDSVVSGNTAQFDNGGIVNYGGTLVLTDSIVSGNSAGTGNGGIANYGGSVTLVDSTVSGNSAVGAGGIGNYGGTLTLMGSTVSGNSAVGDAGILNTGTATLANSTVSGNSAITTGGIANYGGTLSLEGSTVTGNSATGGAGGILNTGFLTLANSTVAGNSAGSGGGIVNAGSALITGSSVSGNSASGSDDPNTGSLILFGNTVAPNRDSGGGIVNTGSLTVADSTISGNSAELNNGGIVDYGGTLSLSGSTVSGNWAAQGNGDSSSVIPTNTGGNLSGSEASSVAAQSIAQPAGTQVLNGRADVAELLSINTGNALSAGSTIQEGVTPATAPAQEASPPIAIFVAARGTVSLEAPAMFTAQASTGDDSSTRADVCESSTQGESMYDGRALAELHFSDQAWPENVKALTNADAADRLAAAVNMKVPQGRFSTPDQAAREHGMVPFASEGDASSNLLAVSLALVFIAQKSGHDRRRSHQHAEMPLAVIRLADTEVLD